MIKNLRELERKFGGFDDVDDHHPCPVVQRAEQGTPSLQCPLAAVIPHTRRAVLLVPCLFSARGERGCWKPFISSGLRPLPHLADYSSV